MAIEDAASAATLRAGRPRAHRSRRARRRAGRGPGAEALGRDLDEPAAISEGSPEAAPQARRRAARRKTESFHIGNGTAGAALAAQGIRAVTRRRPCKGRDSRPISDMNGRFCQIAAGAPQHVVHAAFPPAATGVPERNEQLGEETAGRVGGIVGKTREAPPIPAVRPAKRAVPGEGGRGPARCARPARRRPRGAHLQRAGPRPEPGERKTSGAAPPPNPCCSYGTRRAAPRKGGMALAMRRAPGRGGVRRHLQAP